MSSDGDWRELIDSSFGDGPGHRPMADRLVVGRRALRRRRIGGAVVAVVVAVGVSGAAWGVLPSEQRSEAPVVTTPDDSSDCTGDAQAATDARDAAPGSVVIWTEDGWEVAPGWTVVDQVENPMCYQPPKRSVALELRNGPKHIFALATDDGDGGSGVTSTPVPAGTTLQVWLSAQLDNQRELDGEPVAKPVGFGEGETLVPVEGVTILDQIPHPDLPVNFAGAEDRSAAAWIEFEGKQRFVLVREIYGNVEVIPFTGSFPNLKKFLRFAAQQYESGAGVR